MKRDILFIIAIVALLMASLPIVVIADTAWADDTLNKMFVDYSIAHQLLVPVEDVKVELNCWPYKENWLAVKSSGKDFAIDEILGRTENDRAIYLPAGSIVEAYKHDLTLSHLEIDRYSTRTTERFNYTDYVYGTGVDIYALENCPQNDSLPNLHGIKAVKLNIEAEHDGRVLPFVVIDGQRYEGYIFDRNPKTQRCWTWDDLNTLEIGVQLQSTKCYRIWVDVEFYIGSQTFYNVDFVDVTPGSTGWQDVNVSDYVPVGTTGVLLEVYGYGFPSGNAIGGLRKNGSSDDRRAEPHGYYAYHTWACVGVDSNRIFEAYINVSGRVQYRLVGYTVSGVTFITDTETDYKYEPTTGDWRDTDCSSDAPDAIGILWEQYNTGAETGVGLRHANSTDDRTNNATEHYTWGMISGCNATQYVDLYRGGTGPKFYIIGYITEGCEFNVNADDVSIADEDINSWIDLYQLAANARFGFYEIVTTGAQGGGVRPDGDTTDRWTISLNKHVWAFVGASDTGYVEGYINNIDVDFYEIGWSTATEHKLHVNVAANNTIGVSTTYATVNGNVTGDCDGNITIWAVVWGTTSQANPCLGLPCSDDECGITPDETNYDNYWVSSEGSWSVGEILSHQITGLLPCTTYYWRLYGNTTAGEGYSDELSFTTLATSGDGMSEDGFAYFKEITYSGATGTGTDWPVELWVGESAGSSGVNVHLESNCTDADWSDGEIDNIAFYDNDGATRLYRKVVFTGGSGVNETACIFIRIFDSTESGNISFFMAYGGIGCGSDDGENTFEEKGFYSGFGLNTQELGNPQVAPPSGMSTFSWPETIYWDGKYIQFGDGHQGATHTKYYKYSEQILTSGWRDQDGVGINPGCAGGLIYDANTSEWTVIHRCDGTTNIVIRNTTDEPDEWDSGSWSAKSTVFGPTQMWECGDDLTGPTFITEEDGYTPYVDPSYLDRIWGTYATDGGLSHRTSAGLFYCTDASNASTYVKMPAKNILGCGNLGSATGTTGGRMYATRFTTTRAANISDILVYSAATTGMTTAVYSDDMGNMSTLVASSDKTMGYLGYNHNDVGYEALANNTAYWLAVAYDTDNGSGYKGTGTTKWASITYSTFSWPSNATDIGTLNDSSNAQALWGWTDNPAENPIVMPEPNTYFYNGIWIPNAIRDSATNALEMFFDQRNVNRGIGRANATCAVCGSDDGYWDIQGVVAQPSGVSTDWDGYRLGDPVPRRWNGQPYILYTGFEVGVTTNQLNGIMYADTFQSDGNWTKFKGDWEHDMGRSMELTISSTGVLTADSRSASSWETIKVDPDIYKEDNFRFMADIDTTIPEYVAIGMLEHDHNIELSGRDSIILYRKDSQPCKTISTVSGSNTYQNYGYPTAPWLLEFTHFEGNASIYYNRALKETNISINGELEYAPVIGSYETNDIDIDWIACMPDLGPGNNTVFVEASIQSDYDISVEPTSYDFGLVEESNTYATGIDYFTVTNSGNMTIDITISATNMTNGIQWTLSDTCTPASMVYGLRAGVGS